MMGQQERFGDRLRLYREAAGYSQEQLAELTGLSSNAIGALERGERKRPYPDTIRRLSDALGLGDEARSQFVAASRARGESAPAPPSDPNPQPRGLGELPGEPTPLIDRERESEVIRHLFEQSDGRLLTLTGPERRVWPSTWPMSWLADFPTAWHGSSWRRSSIRRWYFQPLPARSIWRRCPVTASGRRFVSGCEAGGYCWWSTTSSTCSTRRPISPT